MVRGKSLILHLIVALCVIHGHARGQAPARGDWTLLFNGRDLAGWDTYLGPVYDTLLKKRNGKSIGLNVDQEHVFSVTEHDGHPAIRISGKHFGGISTQAEFSDFHLYLEFKWGELRWPPRQDKKRDSGVLYHAVGEHGADGGFWMRSQEYQVQEGDCGDYWGVAGAIFDIPAVRTNEKDFVYNPQGKVITFKAGGDSGRRCIKNRDAEKPTGEWNTIEIYCHGDTAVHTINGVVNMVLYRSRQADGGAEKPLTKGKIQIQSEGAEIYYRNIRVRPTTSIPRQLLQIQ